MKHDLTRIETLFTELLSLAPEARAEALHQACGDFEQAEKLMTEVLSIRREVLPDEHPLVIQGIANLAVMAGSRGKFDQAETLFRESIALSRKVLGNQHPSLAMELSSLSQVLMATRRSTEAEPLLREAVAIQLQRLSPTDVRVLKTRARLAICLFAVGKAEEGAAIGLEALNLREPHLRKGDRFWVDLVAQLENHYRTLGRIDLVKKMSQISDELRPASTQPSPVS